MGEETSEELPATRRLRLVILGFTTIVVWVGFLVSTALTWSGPQQLNHTFTIILLCIIITPLSGFMVILSFSRYPNHPRGE